MIEIEKIYQLLLKNDWPAIIRLLHSHRSEIRSDESLQHAAKIFETELLRKASLSGKEDLSIMDGLDLLYALHKTKYYQLSETNYKQLIVGLVGRKPLEQAYGYAAEFPDEPACMEIIKAYTSNNDKSAPSSTITITEDDWLEIFNRLFEIINEQGDPNKYFTGDRFIKTVKKIQLYFPDYHQYMLQRTAAGRSTTRKHFFYDIFTGMDVRDRVRFTHELLYAVRPFAPQQTLAIEMLMGITRQDTDILSATAAIPAPKNSMPTVFISYAWDNEAHKSWVLALAQKLAADKIDVLLDQWELRAGKSIPFFAEQSLANAGKVLIILHQDIKQRQTTGAVE